MSGAPELSVVVPSVNGWDDLGPCLAALARERVRTPLEVLVPERCGPAVREAAAREFPEARVIPVASGTPIPAMRARAIATAAAATVAVIEDHVRVPAGWAARVLALRAEGHRVVGGGVRNGATASLVDQAAFLCEYSAALALPEGPGEWLPGNNTAYDRALLRDLEPVLAGGRWEDGLHEAIRARGIPLWRASGLVAEHWKHYTAREYLSQRYLYSRSFAGLRLAGASTWQRAGHGVLAFGLPPVLLARILSRARRAGVPAVLLLRALPLLLLFVLAWALGETAGAWLGEGGATARVR
jgi:hypothetical protein